jgi:branched-chain amino acid transport system substrate-binding protein
MQARRWKGIAALVAATALLAGFASGAEARTAAGTSTDSAAADPIKVGIVYTRTGLLATYGAQYIQGLRYGLAYATKGTNSVNGRKIELTIVDDGFDATKAVAAGKDLIGKGYKILAGSVGSGIAAQMAPLAAQNKVLFISGPAAADAVTGINRYTFRSGRQSYQDVLTASSYLGGGTGKLAVVFAQDSAFGLGNYLAVKSVVEDLGGQRVTRILVPLSAQDFTPFAQQLKSSGAGLAFIAWAGTTAPAMWQALDQQNVFSGATKVSTGLDQRSTWPTFGATGAKISFFTHYVWDAPKSNVNDWLVAQLKKRGQRPDLFTPDGFTAAQMIVHALQTAKGDDPNKMVSALEGWRFTAVKGPEYIRPQDHAVLQPMFQVKLVQKGGKWDDKVLGRVSPGNLQPPVKTS